MNESKIDMIKQAAQPCFQCGICSSSCPVFRVAPEFNPRLAVDEIIRTGTIESGIEWYCTQCLKCDQRCPMGVSLAHILLDIKELSSKDGSAPRSVVEIVESVRKCGFVGNTGDSGQRKRKKFGLPELPQPDIGEIRTILSVTSVEQTLSKYRDGGES